MARFEGNEKPPGLVVDRSNATLHMGDIGGERGNCRRGLTLFALRAGTSLSSTGKDQRRPSRRLQLQQSESGVRIWLTWQFPQLYEMPNRAEGSQAATATAIIAVSGLVWVALTW